MHLSDAYKPEYIDCKQRESKYTEEESKNLISRKM